MKKHITWLFFLNLLVLSAPALGQESPALSPKSPIPLTKVEGRMVGIPGHGDREFRAIVIAIPG
jgi:hypothetical protein